MTADRKTQHPNADLLATVRSAARQEQFLEVISPEEARQRFEGVVDRSPLVAETVSITQARGRVLASDLAAETDVPAFDRASVDGFAVRAADTVGAGHRTPRRLLLNSEVIASGHPPALEVRVGTASAIATGGAVPRGADAVVMIEHTELIETPGGPVIEVRRAAAPGQFVAFAGSDIARGEAVLRRGARPVFLPRRTAQPSASDESTGWRAARNRVLPQSAAQGRAAGQVLSGYPRQSSAENTLFRFKTLLGGRLWARGLDSQHTEVRVKCSVLNRMTQLGMPETVRLG